MLGRIYTLVATVLAPLGVMALHGGAAVASTPGFWFSKRLL